ncbi:hypothetical protein HK102_003559 [Quaeritorhiza haematococci]|nr:hypothetical protein HK102_003559 [Quaeritorhiza haematococci]
MSYRCSVAKSLFANATRISTSELSCELPKGPHGRWDFTITDTIGQSVISKPPNQIRYILECGQGTYLRNNTLDAVGFPFDDQCVPCPEGAECTGKTNPPRAQPRFYPSKTNETKFHPCFFPNGCPGNVTSQKFKESSYCEEGYSDYLCSKCDSDRYQTSEGCLKCPTGVEQYILGAILILTPVALAAFGLYSATRDTHTSGFNVLVDFIQTVGMFVTSYPLNWPFDVSTGLQGAAVLEINIDMLRAECSFEMLSIMPRWALFMMLPIIVLIPLVILTFLFMLYRVKRGILAKENILWHTIDFSINGYLSILALLHMPLTTRIVSFFNCVDNKERVYLESAPFITCYQGEHVPMFAFGIVGIFLYSAGIIVAMFMAPCWNRKRLQDPTVLRRFGTVYEAYADNAFYWERLPQFTAYTGIVILAINLLISNRVYPFKFYRSNLALDLSQVALIAILASGIIFLTNPEKFVFYAAITTVYVSVGICICVIGMTCVIEVICVYRSQLQKIAFMKKLYDTRLGRYLVQEYESSPTSSIQRLALLAQEEDALTPRDSKRKTLNRQRSTPTFERGKRLDDKGKGKSPELEILGTHQVETPLSPVPPELPTARYASTPSRSKDKLQIKQHPAKSQVEILRTHQMADTTPLNPVPPELPATRYESAPMRANNESHIRQNLAREEEVETLRTRRMADATSLSPVPQETQHVAARSEAKYKQTERNPTREFEIEILETRQTANETHVNPISPEIQYVPALVDENVQPMQNATQEDDEMQVELKVVEQPISTDLDNLEETLYHQQGFEQPSSSVESQSSFREDQF